VTISARRQVRFEVAVSDLVTALRRMQNVVDLEVAATRSAADMVG